MGSSGSAEANEAASTMTSSATSSSSGVVLSTPVKGNENTKTDAAPTTGTPPKTTTPDKAQSSPTTSTPSSTPRTPVSETPERSSRSPSTSTPPANTSTKSLSPVTPTESSSNTSNNSTSNSNSSSSSISSSSSNSSSSCSTSTTASSPVSGPQVTPSELSQGISIRVSSIRYTQESINDQFADGKKLSGTIEDLKEGRLKSSDFQPMRVVYEQDRKLYRTLDNHLLYCFQVAGIQSISVLIVEKNDEFHRLNTNSTDGILISIKKG